MHIFKPKDLKFAMPKAGLYHKIRKKKKVFVFLPQEGSLKRPIYNFFSVMFAFIN